jgi:hypothetical protein
VIILALPLSCESLPGRKLLRIPAVPTKEVVQPSLNGLLLDLLQLKLVHLAKTMITKLKPTSPQKFLCCAACISVMQYTLSHLGIVPRQPLEWGNGLRAKRDANVDVDPPTFALSQPRDAGDHRDRHRSTTASQRKRQRGAHGVDVGFTK